MPLFDKGLNKSQISVETGIHRKTVRNRIAQLDRSLSRRDAAAAPQGHRRAGAGRTDRDRRAQ